MLEVGFQATRGEGVVLAEGTACAKAERVRHSVWGLPRAWGLLQSELCRGSPEWPKVQGCCACRWDWGRWAQLPARACWWALLLGHKWWRRLAQLGQGLGPGTWLPLSTRGWNTLSGVLGCAAQLLQGPGEAPGVRAVPQGCSYTQTGALWWAAQKSLDGVRQPRFPCWLCPARLPWTSHCSEPDFSFVTWGLEALPCYPHGSVTKVLCSPGSFSKVLT